ncbi:hypothetical protein COV82_00575 [Candidatus Peregrinibacteria bacterium CG11_big_fil_rev_8_21_14_0_20_46_8]|nr:MAG: hypothetical protein COV82_00575 [Candidatus Peregrinibacteria bacterium CG11_big_fil_rev_8_21_14_0_20_46_8]
MSEAKYCKVVVFIPEAYADNIREALAAAGCGKLGKYDSCTFSTKGVGRFRPLEGANPAIGKIGNLEAVEEERIEALCGKGKIDEVLAAIKKVHPYEEPAVEFYSLLHHPQ